MKGNKKYENFFGTFFDDLMFTPAKLQKLNSITKYPSILTYHNLGQKGSLVDSLVEDKHFDEHDVYITEKIDGTNSRVVFCTDDHGSVEDYIIGSREELLYACGDRIITDKQGIVNNMKDVAGTITILGEGKLLPNHLYCLYGETYGGNINGHKHYTGYGSYGIRIFDMWNMKLSDIEEMIEDSDLNRISSWREHGGQPFVHVDKLAEFCEEYSLDRVPYLSIVPGTQIPLTLQEVWDWMQQFQRSVATIDGGAVGMSEGVVVRYGDRSLIRKIRFEDYEKTKKRGLIK